MVAFTPGYSGALGPKAGFTPFVDGKYITGLLLAFFMNGRYNRKINRVAASNMINDGMIMASREGMPGDSD